MRKGMLALFMSSGLAAINPAHELWMEPDAFYLQPGQVAHVSFRVGEDFIGVVPKLTTDVTKTLEHRSGNEVVDLKGALLDDQGAPMKVRVEHEGSHVLVMETNPVFFEMAGEEFTAHLQEDGLDEVFYERKRTQTSDATATGHYSRHTKLILQAGLQNDENYRKVCNLPIEIIPITNPSLLKKGDPISFRILFQGKPLFGAKVKVWNRYNHRISVQNIFSQQDGVIETHVSNRGAWMVSVAKMLPSEDRKVQYRGYAGTLVFEVR